MNKTLCFDFGNTRLKYAVFENDNFTKEGVLPNSSVETINALLDEYQPKKTILSSVIEHDVAIETLLSARTSFHKL
ncbi:MAG TPA: hypothetical protein VK705_00595, partial [Ferruginibacter sp.]|nr:hypothetical protein [Ferruginibacter sp.]